MTLLENGKLLATALVAAVLAAILIGLYLAGSPAEARLLRLDAHRVDDLRSISWAVAEYRRGRGRLPPALDSLPLAIGDAPSVFDPVSRQPYTYEVTGDSSYSLCADFARPSPSDRDNRYDAAWRHLQGHFCFPLVAPGKP